MFHFPLSKATDPCILYLYILSSSTSHRTIAKRRQPRRAKAEGSLRATLRAYYSYRAYIYIMARDFPVIRNNWYLVHTKRLPSPPGASFLSRRGCPTFYFFFLLVHHLIFQLIFYSILYKYKYINYNFQINVY